MVILVMHKIVVFIMYVSMVGIIDQCVLQVLDGNRYYVYVCQLILLVVKVQSLLNHHQVFEIFLLFVYEDYLFTGSSKRKWFHSFTRATMKTTTTVPTTTTTTTVAAATPFGLPSIFTCAGRTNGYYADPVHCHKFHYCTTGIKKEIAFDFLLNESV
jgi:hypothetical protein